MRAAKAALATLAALLIALALGTIGAGPARADSWVRYEAESSSSVTRSGGSSSSDGAASAGAYWMQSVTNQYTTVSCPSNTTGVRVVARRSTSAGIAEMSVDGGAFTDADTYTSGSADYVNVFEVTGLTQGTHTLKANESGRKNAAGSGFTIRIDYYECYQVTPPTTTTSTAAPTTTTTMGFCGPAFNSVTTAMPTSTTAPTTTTTRSCVPLCGYDEREPCLMAIGSYDVTVQFLWVGGILAGAALCLVLMHGLRFVRGI